jgi:hypothetical protein
MKRKKRILLLLRNKDILKNNSPKSYFGWIYDCASDYDFDFWGDGISDTSIFSLNNKIDNFKPDFIYLSLRKKYQISTYNLDSYWLPDLTNIKVPKIFVEVDCYKYDANDSWYKQFDRVLCRQPWWGNWSEVPLFRWSVPEKSFPCAIHKRVGIFFVGRYDGKAYDVRIKMKQMFDSKIGFVVKFSSYFDFMKSVSALICPTESAYGNFIPKKLYEYSASGAAVITNCILEMAGISELEKFVIHYNDLDDLGGKLNIDFRPYHNKAIEVMRNHTHKIRYKELFG